MASDLTRGHNPDPGAPDPDDPGPEFDSDDPRSDDIQAYLDHEAQKRLWLRAIIPLLQLRSHDTDPSGRVQLAFDLMHIAACERVAWILREDMERGQEPDE